MPAKTHSFYVVVLAVMSMSMAGCDQVENVTLHEPGVYQGARDNLETDLAVLQERMKRQMDR